MSFIHINNNQSVPLSSISEVPYPSFRNEVLDFLNGHAERHCVQYFGYTVDNALKLLCCIADDLQHNIAVLSAQVPHGTELESISSLNLSFEKFEREISENFGITFKGHPWPKPVRFPWNAADGSKSMNNYPFFTIPSEELHEVGVGPVHAGIIEPGHFRFVCNGEQVLHLEIQLGYQHRGIEELFIRKNRLIQRSILSESIAGDSVIEHATAFASVAESLSGIRPGPGTSFARTIGQELERVAVHTGDQSALCTDIAYQLGSAVFGRLRTPVINFFQEWCGNRLAKGLIRAGYNPFPFTESLSERLNEVMDDFEPDFTEMNQELSRLPSSLSRFERTGALTYEQLLSIGTVGMSARMNALERDIRKSHPYGLYDSLSHEPVIKHHGDVYSRVQIRREEVIQSLGYIRMLLKELPSNEDSVQEIRMKPDSFALSLTEGWRGEVCHAAITGAEGEIAVYKIKDPSFHNWLALALAVRNNEISDFPVCNKSFNLSYCGHDL